MGTVAIVLWTLRDRFRPGLLFALYLILAGLERFLILQCLKEHDGNKTRAAEALGITREGLHKKLARFGL